LVDKKKDDIIAEPIVEKVPELSWYKYADKDSNLTNTYSTDPIENSVKTASTMPPTSK